MKLLSVFVLAWAAWLPGNCMAQFGITNVHEVAIDSMTVWSVNVASDPAVNVASISARGVLPASFAIEVYNLSASTATLNCGHDINVSSITTSQHYGREVLAGAGVYFGVSQGGRTVFCRTQGGGPTRATITQFK